MLLFMTFDESQSWCYEKNVDTMQKQTRRRNLNLTLKENLQFHSKNLFIVRIFDNLTKILAKYIFCYLNFSTAINGIIYSLKGLRMYTNQLVRWHLINMGSPKDFQSVHFHGQTFFNKKIRSYKQAVYPLLPGNHLFYLLIRLINRADMFTVIFRELCHSRDDPIQAGPVATRDRNWVHPTKGHADPLPGFGRR